MAEQTSTEPTPTDTKTRPKKPRGRAEFWQKELEDSKKTLSKFQKQGSRIVKRFLDERENQLDSTIGGAAGTGQFRLNLFNSNVRTLQDMLYSSLPKVEASRAHADSNDDVARVAADMAERLMNTDIADNGQTYDSVLKSCLQDRLLPGLGCARVRYDVETTLIKVEAQVAENGEVLMEAYETEQVVFEDAPVDYYFWRDVLWGWARSFDEIPWIAFRSYLSHDQVEERFGKEAAKTVTYKTQTASDPKSESDPINDSPWKKAEIWEIWDKEEEQVCWWTADFPKLLDRQPDPLKLNRFFPCPPFLIANATTSLYRPVADFHLSQDLYNEVDVLQTRISILTTAVKVVGVYDSSAEGVTRMFKEGFENDLIPVDSWAMFAETGGLKGAIDWMPVLDIVNTLDKLRDLRDDTIQLLQQVNGMSDVMQGGLNNQYEGVGQTQIKAQFGSVRIQALQDQFATFAGELLQLKLEVICKHFQPETIIKMSNMEFSHDKDLLQPAVELLKQPEMAHVRIAVRPEQVAMVDYAKLKVERTEFLTAMATFMQSAAPMLQQQPSAMPFLLQMLQWSMSGFKGSAEIEGVLDKAVEQAQEQAAQPQEDPAAKEAEQQQQADQAKLQGELQKIQAKTQGDMQIRQQDMQMDINTTMAQTEAKLKEIYANHEANMKEIEAKMRADVLREQVQGEMNMQQTQASAESEMAKDENSAQLDVAAEVEKAAIEIEKDTAQTGLALEQKAQETRGKLTEIMTAAAVAPKASDGDDT